MSHTEFIIQKVCCNFCNKVYYEMPDNGYIKCPHCNIDVNSKDKMVQKLQVPIEIDLNGNITGDVSVFEIIKQEQPVNKGDMKITLIDKETFKSVVINNVTTIGIVENSKTNDLYWGRRYENGSYGLGSPFSPRKYKIIIE